MLLFTSLLARLRDKPRQRRYMDYVRRPPADDCTYHARYAISDLEFRPFVRDRFDIVPLYREASRSPPRLSFLHLRGRECAKYNIYYNETTRVMATVFDVTGEGGGGGGR